MVANVFWDAGSQLTLITSSMAKRLQLRGKSVKLRMTTVGNVTTEIQTYEYQLKLVDSSDTPVVIKAIGIDKISSSVGKVDKAKICRILGIPQNQLNRPSEGEID